MPVVTLLRGLSYIARLIRPRRRRLRTEGVTPEIDEALRPADEALQAVASPSGRPPGPDARSDGQSLDVDVVLLPLDRRARAALRLRQAGYGDVQIAKLLARDPGLVDEREDERRAA